MTGSTGPLISWVTWVETTLVIISIILRFLTRIRRKYKIGLDDYIMLFAAMMQVLAQSFLATAIHWGLGKHIYDLSLPQISRILKFSWMNTTAGILSSLIARVAITVFLVKLFGSKRWLRWYLYVATVVQSITGFMVVISIWAVCKPIWRLWDPTNPGKCWTTRSPIERDLAFLTQSLFSLTDATYVLFPILIVWKLNVKTKDKLGLIFVLSFGLLTVAASILKTVALETNKGINDLTYSKYPLIIWANTEQALVIIIGCVPIIHVLFRGKVQNIRPALRVYISRIKSGHGPRSSSQDQLYNLQHSSPVPDSGPENPKFPSWRMSHDQLIEDHAIPLAPSRVYFSGKWHDRPQ